MSEKHQQQHLFPDGSQNYNKLTEEDKYESRTETDSGFLSSGNLLVSGEITASQEEEEDYKTPSQQPPTSSRDDKEENQSSYMHIDSGVDVCLSENFSSLSLKHPDLNDLNSKGSQKPSTIITTTKEEQQQQSWQNHFEQDEDGDT